MNKELVKLCEDLTTDIKNAYETSVTLEQAEKLAAKFLYGQIQVAEELQQVSLDARMRKAGFKTIKASLRIDEVKKYDKKPTESTLDNLVDTSDVVIREQGPLDAAEVKVVYLENYLDIFKNAHIYFRGIARGKFE